MIGWAAADAGDERPVSGEAYHVLTTAEVAKLTGVTTAMVSSWARSGVLVGDQPDGHAWEFQPDVVTAFCEARARTGLPRRVTAGNPTAFHVTFNRALKREGLTRRSVAATTGLAETTIYQWCAGLAIPWRDSLELLAEAVHEPGLVDLIESRQRHVRITLTCRECGDSREEEAKLVRYWEKDRSPGRIEIDWDKGMGTHTCHSCSARKTVVKHHQNLRKRMSRTEIGQRRSRAVKDWIAAHPEGHAANLHAAQEARRQAPPRDRSEREIARQRLGRLALNPQGIISLCVFCRKMLFTPTVAADPGSAAGRFHRVCWLTSTNWGKWQAACRTAIRTGKPVPPMLLPAAPTGRTTSAEWLSTAYQATLLYFWHLEGSARAFRDETGRHRSVAWLSSKEGREQAPIALSHKGLYEVVKRFLKYLPDETVAAGRMKRWRSAFLVLGTDLINEVDKP